MTTKELRWFDNIKKAFADSDAASQTPRIRDAALESLFKGIDTAKTLRLSLLGMPYKRTENRIRFIEFLEYSIPAKANGARTFELVDAQTGVKKEYSISEIIYDVRCMVHENENLDESEDCNYHILLRWIHNLDEFVLEHSEGRIIINGGLMWRRLREILAHFITGIDTLQNMKRTGKEFVTIIPPMDSILPKKKPTYQLKIKPIL